MKAQLYLLDVPECIVPPLVMARVNLERLQAEHDRILAEAEEARTEGELGHADEWQILVHALEDAREHVIFLEAKEINAAPERSEA
jgi:hypothetical protein